MLLSRLIDLSTVTWKAVIGGVGILTPYPSMGISQPEFMRSLEFMLSFDMVLKV